MFVLVLIISSFLTGIKYQHLPLTEPIKKKQAPIALVPVFSLFNIIPKFLLPHQQCISIYSIALLLSIYFHDEWKQIHIVD